MKKVGAGTGHKSGGIAGPIKAPSGGGRRRAGSAVFLLALFGVTLGALGHVAVQAKTVEVAVQLGTERSRHEELIAEQRRLELLVGQLEDPGRLMQEGRKRGMVATAAAIRIVNRPHGAPGAIRRGAP